MAYINKSKIWRTEFQNNICAKYKLKAINLNQSKLELKNVIRKIKKKQILKIVMLKML